VKDGRGVAVADFNNDGRLDLVMNANNETPVLYMNNLKKTGSSVELKLVGTESNRDAIGACVWLTAGGKKMMRQVEAGSGYASEMMRPLHFGLGKADHVDAIEIRWPSGREQRLKGQELANMMKGSRQVRIEEGDPQITQITQR
jgi:hypothetical protein